MSAETFGEQQRLLLPIHGAFGSDTPVILMPPMNFILGRATIPSGALPFQEQRRTFEQEGWEVVDPIIMPDIMKTSVEDIRESVIDQTRAVLDANPNKTVVVGAHSLGGAFFANALVRGAFKDRRNLADPVILDAPFDPTHIKGPLQRLAKAHPEQIKRYQGLNEETFQEAKLAHERNDGSRMIIVGSTKSDTLYLAGSIPDGLAGSERYAFVHGNDTIPEELGPDVRTVRVKRRAELGILFSWHVDVDHVGILMHPAASRHILELANIQADAHQQPKAEPSRRKSEFANVASLDHHRRRRFANTAMATAAGRSVGGQSGN